MPRWFSKNLWLKRCHFEMLNSTRCSTVMLHHLPRKVREQAAAEMRRVLTPGGRVVVVDFGGNTAKKSLLDHFHRRHGYVALSDILALLGEAGLKIIESGAVGVRDLHFVLAAVPCCA